MLFSAFVIIIVVVVVTIIICRFSKMLNMFSFCN